MTPSAASLVRTQAGTLRAPWRVAAFGILLVGVAFFVAQTGLAMAAWTPLERWARWARLSLDIWETALALLLATWATGRALHGRDHDIWRIVALDRPAWKPRTVAFGVVAGTLVIAAPALLMVATGQMRFEPATATESPLVVAWSAVALMLPAAAWEELLMRGYVFSAVRDGAGTAAAVAVTSVGFGLAHVTNPDPTVLSLVAVTVAGVFLALIRVATGSLAAAIAAHLAFNLTQSVVLHAPVSGLALQTPGYRLAPVGPAWLTGGSWGPEGGVAVIVALTLASFMLAQDARRKKQEERSADALAEVPRDEPSTEPES